MNSIGTFSLLLVVGRDGVGVSLVSGKKGKRSLPMSQGIKSHLFLDIYASRVIIAKRTSDVSYKHHLASKKDMFWWPKIESLAETKKEQPDAKKKLIEGIDNVISIWLVSTYNCETYLCCKHF